MYMTWRTIGRRPVVGCAVAEGGCGPKKSSILLLVPLLFCEEVLFSVRDLGYNEEDFSATSTTKQYTQDGSYKRTEEEKIPN